MTERKSILIVGVGSIGERHLRCFASTGRADVAICEVNKSLRETVAERYQIKRAFDNLERALAAEPDAVVVCTPAQLHIPIALAAAQKPAHLLIEKPLSTKLDGLDSLQREINNNQLIAAVAYVYRAHPALSAMREVIQSNRFGEPVQLIATFGQNFPFYRPAYRDTYYKDRATGGGAVQDALTHIINAGEWLVGPIDRLVADLGHQLIEGVEVEDTVNVLTRHGKAMGSFSLNQHQAPNEGTITVNCERGTAQFEYHNCRWRWMTEPGAKWHEESFGPLERDELFTRQANSFLDAIDGDKLPLCSLEEGTQTLRVNLGILESAQDRQWKEITRK